MFDTSKPISVQIFSGGVKSFVVQYPSDADWREYFRHQTVVYKRVEDADGVEATAVGVEASSLAIVRRVIVGEARFDEYEAAEIVRKLDFTRVESAVIAGDSATITLGALRGKGGAQFVGLVHVLRLPSQRQIMEYRRGSMRVVEGRQRRETRQPIEPGEQLYDALTQRVDGYARAVPANHKATVTDALIAAVDALLSEMEGSTDPEV